ncbi:MAG: hypothetical protein ABIK09_11045 [Pseudomonadota bacterium]
MSDTTLKRRRATTKATPGYPSADEVGQDRRRFLHLVAKGLLGVSVLGLARCNPGAGDPILKDGFTGDVLEPDEWVTAGVAPPPDTVDDVYDPDWNIQGGITAPDAVEDLNDEDWALGGAPRPPDTVDTLEDVVDSDYQIGGVVALDVQAPDTCTIEDVEGEFPPLLGDMPAPDVITHADTTEEDADAFPPLDGDMAYPEKPRPRGRRERR